MNKELLAFAHDTYANATNKVKPEWYDGQQSDDSEKYPDDGDADNGTALRLTQQMKVLQTQLDEVKTSLKEKLAYDPTGDRTKQSKVISELAQSLLHNYLLPKDWPEDDGKYSVILEGIRNLNFAPFDKDGEESAKNDHSFYKGENQ